MGSGDPSIDFHVCTASTLPTEPSSQISLSDFALNNMELDYSDISMPWSDELNQ